MVTNHTPGGPYQYHHLAHAEVIRNSPFGNGPNAGPAFLDRVVQVLGISKLTAAESEPVLSPSEAKRIQLMGKLPDEKRAHIESTFHTSTVSGFIAAVDVERYRYPGKSDWEIHLGHHRLVAESTETDEGLNAQAQLSHMLLKGSHKDAHFLF